MTEDTVMKLAAELGVELRGWMCGRLFIVKRYGTRRAWLYLPEGFPWRFEDGDCAEVLRAEIHALDRWVAENPA